MKLVSSLHCPLSQFHSNGPGIRLAAVEPESTATSKERAHCNLQECRSSSALGDQRGPSNSPELGRVGEVPGGARQGEAERLNCHGRANGRRGQAAQRRPA